MKTYIFNTNFSLKDEKNDGLITKQKKFMEQCDGMIAISSAKAMYNYNDNLNYSGSHIKSLCHGLYVEDALGQVRIDKHFPKTKALFIATMWAEQDLYVVADNGFFTAGKYFNNLLKNEDKSNMKDLYTLDRIYLIYLKGDMRDNVLLENFYVTYDQVNDYSIVSYGKLEPENLLQIITGYTYAYSDSTYDLSLLNKVDAGYAIGDSFEIAELGEKVEHVSIYYFINKYIELYI